MRVFAETDIRTVVLIGNPNTGKSTIFSGLSGLQQRTGNYAGVTVEKKIGEVVHAGQRWMLIDLPGTYSLAARSPDELVAVDVLLGRCLDVPAPDVIMCVIDATNLRRNLYLLSQVLELQRPTVIALTMLDVARQRGLKLDLRRLEANLGVKVVPVQALKRHGIEALRKAVAQAQPPLHAPTVLFPPAFATEVDRLQSACNGHLQGIHGTDPAGIPIPRYLAERMLLDVGGVLENGRRSRVPGELANLLAAARGRLLAANCPVPAIETQARYAWVQTILEGVVAEPPRTSPIASDRIDAVLTHRLWGTLFLIAVLLLTFSAVYSWANWPMQLIESAVAGLSQLVASNLPPGALRSLITDGVIGGIGAVMIFLPQIMILFGFLGLLEDCGYLARAAYLMDRLMMRVGLSGKSFIPLLSSFACAIPGVMATRVIEDRRDRLATILVAPLMSCSARLPVYTLMIAAFLPDRPLLGPWVSLRGLTLLAMYLVGIVTAAILAILFKRTILRGPTQSFMMELPSYKWPSLKVVLLRMLDRAGAFLTQAGTIILAVSVVMWALLYYPRLGPQDQAPFEIQRQALLQTRATTDSPEAKEAIAASLRRLDNAEAGYQMRHSLLGRAGRWMEPSVRPLGWDWRIGSAVIASFPAREVVVATLGVMFDVGGDDSEANAPTLRQALQSATWPGTERPLFTIPVALSIMVFFALCAQCVSTLAIIRRETNRWSWAVFSFVYMTILAYLGALVTYQLGTRLMS